MTYICYRGIEVSARLQYALLGIELLVLLAFAIIALVKVFSGDAPDGSMVPSLAWLWPDGISLSDFADAILIAVFLYWGWDTAVAVNEESDDPAKTPGRAAVLSTVLLVVTYVLVAVATVAFAGTGTDGIGLGNPDNASDVFAAVGPAVFGDSPIGSVFVVLLIISVLTSSSASTQTTILPTARAALSMGAYRAIPVALREDPPEVPDAQLRHVGDGHRVDHVLRGAHAHQHERARRLDRGRRACSSRSTTASPGSRASGTTASTCRAGTCGPRVCCPGLGGLMLLGAFIQASITYASPDGGETTVFGIGGVFVIGIGSLVLGAVLMFIYSRVAPPFFRGETLTKGSHDLILPPSHPIGIGLPDSREETVIAPDLSNLPPGQKPLDPRD